MEDQLKCGIINMKTIGIVRGYYGPLYVKIEDDKYYWGISNHSGIDVWEEIDKELYDSLTAYEERRIKENDHERRKY